MRWDNVKHVESRTGFSGCGANNELKVAPELANNVRVSIEMLSINSWIRFETKTNGTSLEVMNRRKKTQPRKHCLEKKQKHYW